MLLCIVCLLGQCCSVSEISRATVDNIYERFGKKKRRLKFLKSHIDILYTRVVFLLIIYTLVYFAITYTRTVFGRAVVSVWSNNNIIIDRRGHTAAALFVQCLNTPVSGTLVSVLIFCF